MHFHYLLWTIYPLKEYIIHQMNIQSDKSPSFCLELLILFQNLHNFDYQLIKLLLIDFTISITVQFVEDFPDVLLCWMLNMERVCEFVEDECQLMEFY